MALRLLRLGFGSATASGSDTASDADLRDRLRLECVDARPMSPLADCGNFGSCDGSPSARDTASVRDLARPAQAWSVDAGLRLLRLGFGVERRPPARTPPSDAASADLVSMRLGVAFSVGAILAHDSWSLGDALLYGRASATGSGWDRRDAGLRLLALGLRRGRSDRDLERIGVRFRLVVS